MKNHSWVVSLGLLALSAVAVSGCKQKPLRYNVLLAPEVDPDSVSVTIAGKPVTSRRRST